MNAVGLLSSDVESDARDCLALAPPPRVCGEVYLTLPQVHQTGYGSDLTQTAGGVEGVTYSPGEDAFYFLKEKAPSLVLRMDRQPPNAKRTLATVTSVGDVAGISHVPGAGPGTDGDRLLVISDKSKQVLLMRPDGTLVGPPLALSVPSKSKPEGISILPLDAGR